MTYRSQVSAVVGEDCVNFWGRMEESDDMNLEMLGYQQKGGKSKGCFEDVGDG